MPSATRASPAPPWWSCRRWTSPRSCSPTVSTTRTTAATSSACAAASTTPSPARWCSFVDRLRLVVILDRPPALVLAARDLLRPVPVRVPVREDVRGAAVMPEGALVVHSLVGELWVRGDAADVTGRARLVV